MTNNKPLKLITLALLILTIFLMPFCYGIFQSSQTDCKKVNGLVYLSGTVDGYVLLKLTNTKRNEVDYHLSTVKNGKLVDHAYLDLDGKNFEGITHNTTRPERVEVVAEKINGEATKNPVATFVFDIYLSGLRYNIFNS